MSEINWLEARLPPIRTIRIRSEPDYYGASWIIAGQLGKRSPPYSFATWRHGWVYQPVVHPRQLVTLGTERDRHLVANEAHVRALKDFGFPNTTAVGLPFLYADTVHVEREPGTLLVMPSHSLPYTSHSWDERGYVEQIAALRPHFSRIVACVHSSCVAKGLWIHEFERHGIPWIIGAAVDDSNALRRMTTIFKSSETMTTNVIGSHIAYAAYSGCRVSIFGPYASFSREDFANDQWYAKYPDLLDAVIDFNQESVIKERFPEFFVPPPSAVQRTEWAAETLGTASRRAPEDIARLLGWSTVGQVSGTIKRAAQYVGRRVAIRD